ncbi:SigE family RNA polymerase sigma factor [Planosporangium mesophilum]|uniref:RNA polymerase sigma24 factor n=1 Tax=Planosporangium mesophilum TaxID=689768 RepID=A0A8J3TJ45_9ACTN|nr:SigE family RNA polymerase sigma factor [Planosporangium mesophilum]NJC86467.1 SigE family RNA polymerase sigma factor [Planosporangium mesophilum]GII26112.1 RNA polymerase sigma24 factor [Planosporangium mesophilum]
MQFAADEGGPEGAPPDGRRPPVRNPADDPATGFDAFYAARFERLVVQLYAYTGDMAQAQDVVQEAFARALPRWEKLSRYHDPTAWVRRVAWNLATSRWRQLRTFNAFARRQREEHVKGPTPDRVALTAALATLPPKLRRAVVLHYLSDMSVAEIAVQEGVADGTVKSWLHRGRAALAAALTDTQAEVRDV